MKDQQILMCVEASRLARFHGIVESPGLRLQACGAVVAVTRKQAEADPHYKQLAAYCAVLKVVDGVAHVLTYSRPPATAESGEPLLQGLMSAGFGGHVEYQDTQGSFALDAVTTAAARELSEELGITAKLVAVGLINHDDTFVGQCHLGVLYTAVVPPDVELRPNLEVRGLQWYPLSEAYENRRSYEYWSELSLAYLKGWTNGRVV